MSKKIFVLTYIIVLTYTPVLTYTLELAYYSFWYLVYTHTHIDRQTVTFDSSKQYLSGRITYQAYAPYYIRHWSWCTISHLKLVAATAKRYISRQPWVALPYRYRTYPNWESYFLPHALCLVLNIIEWTVIVYEYTNTNVPVVAVRGLIHNQGYALKTGPNFSGFWTAKEHPHNPSSLKLEWTADA